MITVLQQRAMKYGLRELLSLKRKINLDQGLDCFYFGYGANLSIDRFKKWNIPAEVVGPAFIKDHMLKFNLPCEYKGKGYAGIEHEAGQTVWGILFKVNESALKMLDVLEWVPFSFYERKLFDVSHDNEIYTNVHAYVTCHPKKNLVPSKGYLDYIISEGKKADFPETYLSYLSSIQSESSFELDPTFVLRNPSQSRLFSDKLGKLYLQHDVLREKLTKVIP